MANLIVKSINTTCCLFLLEFQNISVCYHSHIVESLNADTLPKLNKFNFLVLNMISKVERSLKTLQTFECLL